MYMKKIFKNNNKSSLHFKLLLSFWIFTIIIIILLWLFQTVFFSGYYEFTKKNEIISIANDIKNNITSKDLQNEIDEEAYRYSANIYIIENNYLTYSSNTSELTSEGPVINNYNIFDVGIISRVTSKKFDIDMFVYVESINKTTKILVTTAVEPVASTTKILSNQLIYISFLIIGIGFLISYYISNILSKPIKKIEEEAHLLAEGNYDIEFTKGNYSEINNLSDTLSKTAKELKKTDELRRELMANISHDLKTPLTMIKSYAELLIDIPQNKKDKNKKLEIIIDETNRLNLLVNDIVDLSKLESNIEALNIQKISISDLLNTIIERFDYLIEKENYIIETNIDQNLYTKVDQKRISQAIYNLIGNAINYTGPDKKIRINLIEENNNIKFEVIDTGKGIKKEDIEKIWDKYYTVNVKYKRKIISTGLGLNIVKNILNEHKLNFGVKSIVGKGSTFYIEFCKEK